MCEQFSRQNWACHPHAARGGAHLRLGALALEGAGAAREQKVLGVGSAPRGAGPGRGCSASTWRHVVRDGLKERHVMHTNESTAAA